MTLVADHPQFQTHSLKACEERGACWPTILCVFLPFCQRAEQA